MKIVVIGGTGLIGSEEWLHQPVLTVKG